MYSNLGCFFPHINHIFFSSNMIAKKLCKQANKQYMNQLIVLIAHHHAIKGVLNELNLESEKMN